MHFAQKTIKWNWVDAIWNWNCLKSFQINDLPQIIVLYTFKFKFHGNSLSISIIQFILSIFQDFDIDMYQVLYIFNRKE